MNRALLWAIKSRTHGLRAKLVPSTMCVVGRPASTLARL